MAFEPLPPPVLPVIRKPTPEEMAEAFSQSVATAPVTPIESVDRQDWPAGSVCQCQRRRKDGQPCGHSWKTRIAGKPHACPKCKQSRWDEEPHQRKRRA